MLRVLIAGLLLFSSHAASSSDYPMEARTPKGGIVILHEDGRWEKKTQIDEGSSLVFYYSRLDFFDFRFDEKLWEIIGHGEMVTSAPLFEFQNPTGEAWCNLIPERSQISQEQLIPIIISNFKSRIANFKILQRYKLEINGLSTDIVEISGSLKGYNVAYSTLAWTGQSGTIQISCWTFPNLLNEYRPRFESFFSGLSLATD